MLSVFYGTDWKKINQAALKRLEVFLDTHRGAETFALSADNFSISELERYSTSSGLFTSLYVIVIVHLLQHDEYGGVLAEHLAALAESPNLFILKEGALSVAHKKLVEKYAQESNEYMARETVRPTFQIFDLANALGMHDKKNLWLGYQRALRSGSGPEEIANILMWQVKTMLQVAADATDGMKPFVLGKAQGFIKNYSQQELRTVSLALVSLYHDSRRGSVDFEKGLERIILSI